MIKTILLSICTITAVSAMAQETIQTLPLPPERKNEIGIFSNSVISGNSNNNLMMAGVQYKHWVKPNKAYRSLVSFGRYSIHDMRPSNKAPNNDTIYQVFSNTNVNMAFIGAGIEMQRHFYKKLYLFAALEVRGGAGRGRGEDMLAAQYKEPGSNYYSTNNLVTINSNSVSATYVGLVPSIGGKFQFNRVSFGAELSPLEMAYKSVNTNGSQSSMTDFELGKFTNRFFINFRF